MLPTFISAMSPTSGTLLPSRRMYSAKSKRRRLSAIGRPLPQRPEIRPCYCRQPKTSIRMLFGSGLRTPHQLAVSRQLENMQLNCSNFSSGSHARSGKGSWQPILSMRSIRTYWCVLVGRLAHGLGETAWRRIWASSRYGATSRWKSQGQHATGPPSSFRRLGERRLDTGSLQGREREEAAKKAKRPRKRRRGPNRA